ncbi:substrate-binding and VWA domain-containing protein [Mycobacterium sp. MYCO198283]|uniref:substrate-binding and VWA domain-containing protein n=1 Tax=Mycobacterium sp. MYCO198283 TaxID=2883505 RepID=UPI001E55B327|nr:substrate-binding and VWA domain-containing protein [Mycobacterium sp. MYCO198283]MCG5433191.1 substrate-binding and VWA domain-containing protein [Mycobacterium sp. MYCO198283]
MGKHSIPDPDDQDDPVGGGRPADPPPPRPRGRRPDEPDYRTPFGEGPYGDYDDRSAYGDDDDRSAEPYPPEPYRPEPAEPSDADEPDDLTSGLTATGGHRVADEWTGSHRTVAAGRRGVSRGVIVALVTVVVVVAGFIVWRFLGDALSDRSGTAAERCVAGDVAVRVVADPSIAEEIGRFAQRFNETAGPVGDHCPNVTVAAADSNAVVGGFAGTWPAELGERPALWVPASSVSTARLEAIAGDQAVGNSRSLVTSPVVVAVRPELRDALTQQGWGGLPGLQTNPTALDALNLPGWGSLRLALPTAGSADASYLAAEAVAAASAPPGAPATAGLGAVSALRAGQPDLADDTLGTAIDALLAGAPATSPAHAVVVTEQQLYQRAANVPDAGQRLASWLPNGDVPTADYPTAELNGDWLSTEQRESANAFSQFLRQPDQLKELAGAGFRTDVGALPSSEVTTFAPLAPPLQIGDNAVRVALADAATAAPTAAPAATIMLDTSMPQLAGAAAAVRDRLAALAPNAAIGLWTFNGTQGGSVVPTGPPGEALTNALNGLAPTSDGAVSFTTLRLAYGEAVTNFRPNQPNSVLVITAGPHTDRTLDGPGLQDYIRGAVDPARPVAVNVIDIGADPDRPTWEAVAQASGGQYRNVPAADSPELAAAVAELLA